MKTKCEYGAPSRSLDANARVLEYDQAGTDNGARIVTLVKGWAFYDAAKNEGDDPDGASACHSSAFSTVKEALEAIRGAQPCKCGRCLGVAS